MAAGAFRLTGLALGSAASPSLQFTGTGSNDGIFSPGNDRLSLVTAGVARLEVGAGGSVWINDTSNAAMTLGLTVQQGGNDNELFAGKSTDVTHGMTDNAEADTFFAVSKADAGAGGVQLTGFSSSNKAMVLAGYHTTEDFTHNAGSVGAIHITGGLRSGTAVVGMTAGSNILVVQNGSTTRFVMDADGQSYSDAATTWTLYDEEDDVGLLNLLSAHLTRRDDPLRASFSGWLSQNRAILEEMHMVTFNDGPGQDGSIFLNESRLAMLHTGAIRQLGAKLSRCERAIMAAGIALTE